MESESNRLEIAVLNATMGPSGGEVPEETVVWRCEVGVVTDLNHDLTTQTKNRPYTFCPFTLPFSHLQNRTPRHSLLGLFSGV